ncbi:MAG: heavy metal translocating P-type ATPase [Halobacteriaceae archaeon]
MAECTVCGHETPDPPKTAEDVPGQYCCEGCLAVAREVEDPATADIGGHSPDGTIDGDTDTSVVAVDGMHCATCEAFLEDQATEIDGVVDAEATYAAELVRVTHEPGVGTGDLVDGLTVAGYRAHDARDDDAAEQEDAGRLLVGGFFTLMSMMWYVLFLYPVYLGVPSEDLLLDVTGPAGTYVLGMVWVFATAVLAYTGAPLFRSAIVSLRARQPNVDLLVALAAGTAYLYSAVALLVGRVEVYFDVAMVIVVVVTLGRHYERRVRRRASDALSELAAARVDTARRRTDSGIETVDVDALEPGDDVVVRPGERIPVDGTVLDGVAAVDESLITGEAAPVRKEPGDDVIGGAVATDGELVITPTEAGESTVDRLVELLWEVQSERTGPQRLADRIARVFVPSVVVIAVLATVAALVTGATTTAALLTGLAVLVVSCPCALGLATPLAVASGLRTALAHGIVLTDRAAVERAPGIDVVALDKTGTLTTGSMTVVDVYGSPDTLERAGAVEQFADHPVAEAIAETAAVDSDVGSVDRSPGRGVEATVDGETVVVGRESLIDDHDLAIPPHLAGRYELAQSRGYTPSYVGWGDRVQGVVVAGDEYRPGWQATVETVADSADRVVVLTGDTAAAAQRLGTCEAIDEVFARVRPSGKAAVVERLRDRGSVAFVGDGSNDAPALAAADVGIAMGSGTDVAGDAADAVVVDDDLTAVPTVFAVTRATRRRVRENLAWAFGYNLVAIPLAATGLLNPLFAAIAMSASSLLVVGNSTRALLDKDDTLDPATDRTDTLAPDPPTGQSPPGAGPATATDGGSPTRPGDRGSLLE